MGYVAPQQGNSVPTGHIAEVVTIFIGPSHLLCTAGTQQGLFPISLQCILVSVCVCVRNVVSA